VLWLALPYLAITTFPIAVPTAADVLHLMQHREEQVENLALTAVWSNYERGRLVKTERQTIHQDRLGRIRVQYEVVRPGGEPTWRDELFNGEITLKAVDGLAINVLGEKNLGKSHAPGDQYRHAFIYDGSPPGQSPSSHRNAFTTTHGGVVSGLERVLTSGGVITVSQVADSAMLFELQFQLPAEVDKYHLQHVVVVDASKGWVVLSHEQFFPDSNKLSSRRTCEYVEDPTGIWVPSHGSLKVWGAGGSDGSDVPVWEWAFRVEKIVVNDPNFDEGVFVPSLRPGTYVSDLRHGAHYRVGDEGAIDEQLTLLAQQARAEEAANLQRIEDERKRLEASESGWRIGSGLRFWLVAINVVVVAAIVAVWYYRRKAAA
jgi:hypothetical protein